MLARRSGASLNLKLQQQRRYPGTLSYNAGIKLITQFACHQLRLQELL